MRIGLLADTHDHLDNIRRAIDWFNASQCDLVVFAGDFVSTFAIPPFRALRCPMIAGFGDNEGNRIGIQGGMSLMGPVADPPFCFRSPDGLRFLVTHQRHLIRGMQQGADVVVYAHSHRPRIERDSSGRLHINPGETSGWTYGRPSIAVLETTSMHAELIWLDEQAPSNHGRNRAS